MLLERGRPLQQARAFPVRDALRSPAKVPQNNERVEMRLSHPNGLKRRLRRGKSFKRFRREIIHVVRHDIAILHTQQSHRQRLQVRRQHETVPARFQDRRRLSEECLRPGQMFDHRPECDRIETPTTGFKIQKRFANDLQAAALRIIQCSAGHIRTRNPIISRIARLQLE